MKFQGDEVLDTLNEFADSTLEFGSSIFKRLKTEVLSLASNHDLSIPNQSAGAQQSQNFKKNTQDEDIEFESPVKQESVRRQ